MAIKAPGKHQREGLTLIQIIEKFGSDEAAKRWFTECLWPQGPYCPRCGSFDVAEVNHPSMTHRCRDCEGRKLFSLKTGTVMHGSKLGYRVWAIAIYLFVTNLKGVSSMKLHRDLGIAQKNAWHLAHRIREAWGPREQAAFGGPVEVDETYVGGKRKNMPLKKRKGLTGRGTAGKTIVVGAKDRDTNRVSATVVRDTAAWTLQGFIADRTEAGAKVYTDEHQSYVGMSFDHEAVKHSVGEYVRDMAHTNGMESFWSMLKRGYAGTFHKISPKHLDRYVIEFAERHNGREDDTLDMMGNVAEGMAGRRLRYEDLIADRKAA